MVASESIKRRASTALIISCGLGLLMLLSVMEVRSNLCCACALCLILINKFGFQSMSDASKVGLPRSCGSCLCGNTEGGILGEMHTKRNNFGRCG